MAGLAEADRLIEWAHSIELVDPTPWLNGGELVMTTGLNIGRTEDAQFDYVARLVQSRSAALAFDTGTTFPQVPPGIVAAGDALGLPVLAVPASTPFIAITRAVIEELTKDQLRSTQRVVEQQENLARATLKGGIPATVSVLSRVISASVAVIDIDGQVLAAHGTDAVWATENAREVANAALPRSGRRGSISKTVHDPRGHCTILSVAAFGSVRAYLAIICPDPLSAPDRLLVAHTISLLSIDLAKPAKVVDVEQRLRRNVASALISLGSTLDVGILRYFDLDPEDEVAALNLANIGPLLTAEMHVDECLSAQTSPYLMTQRDDQLVIVLPALRSETIGRELHGFLSAQLQRKVKAGQGNPALLADVGRSAREASVAARSAGDGEYVVFAEVGASSFLLSHQTPADLAVLARTMLRNLDEYDSRSSSASGKLVHTLQVFLEHNGEREAAAASLGIHRHTMRNRLTKIRELTGRNLDSAQVRADLWLAIMARELQSPTTN